jgi:hypothetical protein
MTILGVDQSLADRIMLARIYEMDFEDKEFQSWFGNKLNLIICLYFYFRY